MTRLCIICNQDIDVLMEGGCTQNTAWYPNGDSLPSIPFAGVGYCPICHVKSGYCHHPGCTLERCPRCHGTMPNCGCFDSPFIPPIDDGNSYTMSAVQRILKRALCEWHCNISDAAIEESEWMSCFNKLLHEAYATTGGNREQPYDH